MDTQRALLECAKTHCLAMPERWDETSCLITFLRTLKRPVKAHLFALDGMYVLDFMPYRTFTSLTICGQHGKAVIIAHIYRSTRMHICNFFDSCSPIAKSEFQRSSSRCWSTATHAFTLIRWLCLAMRIRNITLVDAWTQLYNDGTWMCSATYQRLFVRFAKGHKPETDLECKFYSEYQDACRHGLSVRVIEHGWYARFGFASDGMYMKVAAARIKT